MGDGVSRMPDDQARRLDDEVAELTDVLLRGEPPVASAEAAPLLDVARRLNVLIGPRVGPSAAFERELRGEIEREWAVRPAQSATRTSVTRRWVWLAAAAAVLLLVFLVIPIDASFPLALSGAAAGNGGAPAIEVPLRALVFVLGLGGLAVYWWYRLRR